MQMTRYSSEMSTGSGVLGPEKRLFAMGKGFSMRFVQILGFHDIDREEMISRRSVTSDSPWISKEGFPDHEPMGSSVSCILQQVVIYAHISVADNRYMEVISQSLDFVEVSRALSSSASRYCARM